jgi:hypothetical protein
VVHLLRKMDCIDLGRNEHSVVASTTVPVTVPAVPAIVAAPANASFAGAAASAPVG